jgi:hypothetical protein
VELKQLGVLLVVTSRRAVNARLEGPLSIHLPSLPEADAVQLLRSCAGANAVIEEEEASKLAWICSCNALAITIIAAFLSSGVVTAPVRLLRLS